MHVCPERRPGRREEEKTAFLRLPRLLYWRGKKAVRVCSPPRGLSGAGLSRQRSTYCCDRRRLRHLRCRLDRPLRPRARARGSCPCQQGGVERQGKRPPHPCKSCCKAKGRAHRERGSRAGSSTKGRRTKGRAQSKRGSSASVCGASVWVPRHPRHPAQGSFWNSGWRPRANFCFVV